MLRVVIDTNVLVSNILSKAGTPSKVIDTWRAQKFSLITSEAAIQELQSTLEKLHRSKKYSIPDEDIAEFTEMLRKNGQPISALPNVTGAIPADPDDEKFLAMAMEGDASIIVSGDKHLLDLKEYQGITILTPRQFLDSLDAE